MPRKLFSRQKRFKNIKNDKKIIIASLLLLTMAFPVFAQDSTVIAETNEITAEDLEIKEPNLLPDSPFYFLKEGWRKAREIFTFNNIKKTELKERFSAERLIELRKMAAQDAEAKILEKATDNYQREKKQIEERIMAMEGNADENPEINKFMEKFTRQQILHQQILEKLESQVPAKVMEKIQEQRQEHLNQFKEVMLKLENKENIPEKLEKALDTIEEGEFGGIKKMEFFQEMKEIMPEEIQEKFKEKEERQIETFKEKLEEMPEETQKKFQKFIEEIPVQEQRQLQILEKVKMRLEESGLKEEMNLRLKAKTQTGNQNQPLPQE